MRRKRQRDSPPPEGKKKLKGNQHLPRPQPEDELHQWIHYYWHLGFNDKKIAEHVLDHFNKQEYGLSAKTVQRIRKELNLLGTRQQQASFETVMPYFTELRRLYPNMGARAMVTVLRQEYNLKVPEKLLNDLFNHIEPDKVKQRKYKRFKRRRFWSAGIMDVLTMDQHDKHQRFGIRYHLGFDPFPGRIAWFRVWWSNRNPKITAKYFLDSCREREGVPLVTQSDPGSENYGPANCQTAIRHRLDPSLIKTRQHRWKNHTQNVKPEAVWSQMRRNFFPGIETALEVDVTQGLYNINNPLEKLLFRYLAIPLLQALCDTYTRRYNSSPRRSDKRKVLPQGIPDLICAKPHLFNTEDFTIKVPEDLFDEMEAKYAPPEDPALQLTPPEFQALADMAYQRLGSPVVRLENLWNVYIDMLQALRQLEETQTDEFVVVLEASDSGYDFEMELIPGLDELREGLAITPGGPCYMGGVNLEREHRLRRWEVRKEIARVMEVVMMEKTFGSMFNGQISIAKGMLFSCIL
ncbi:hypothetical protein BT96DRAFT_1009240 [Gymnopus androsaceus JB14]|uniref:Integrase catalytic domain-containing protein n=1 Tax=Gymnopus androsaceus JB14 TaxID=1447944 RepID=A0A6A4GD90_9AGAR|nr:hypothetical protein BT96DRAFT_1009240 [Gymnopus androsaceus JB14]